jgi:peptidylprolyl isomerase
MKRLLMSCLLTCSFGAGLPALPKPPVPSLTKTASGLQYADLQPGKGECPKAGQTCSLLYQGWLFVDGKRGKLFDECQDRKRPFSFRVGLGEVIKGWDEGILTMKKGGRRILVIPPDLAYGDKDLGDIPPGSTLLFEVQLLAVNVAPRP